MRLRSGLCLTAALGSLCLMSSAQMPDFNILQRTAMIRVALSKKTVEGTTFALDVDGREYWITAKHLITGEDKAPEEAVPKKTVTVKLLNPGAMTTTWLTETFSVIDTGPGVDIVVLAPPRPILTRPLPSPEATSAGVFVGGPCEFLGYPFGSAWQAKMSNGSLFWLPFVKHCTVSAVTAETRQARFQVLFLDAFANPGFSGGPVIFRRGSEERVAGVISSSELQPIKVSLPTLPGILVNAPNAKQDAGFALAFDIKYAIDAIHKDPIGPLRVEK